MIGNSAQVFGDNEWYDATSSLEVAVDRLALFFKALVERFGPYAEWEHPDYPSVARLAEFRAFLTEHRKAGLTLPLTHVAWATGGYVRRCRSPRTAVLH